MKGNSKLEIVLSFVGLFLCGLIFSYSFEYLIFGDQNVDKIILAVLFISLVMSLSYSLNENIFNKNNWREKEWDLLK